MTFRARHLLAAVVLSAAGMWSAAALCLRWLFVPARPRRDVVSRPGRAFANGTEGYGWMANWCDRCLVDAPFRNGIKGATGCPLILQAMTGQTPDEWLDGPRDEQGRYSIADQYHCIDFKPEGWRDPEPRPKPTPPNQGELFPRAEAEGRRVLTTAPSEARA